MSKIKGDFAISRNISFNSLTANNISITTSTSGTTYHNSFSPTIFVFNGTAIGHSFILDDATQYISSGLVILAVNNTSQSIAIKNNGSTTLLDLRSGLSVIISLEDKSTTNGIWNLSAIPNGDLAAALVSFDNSTNGFTATNVQAAIEEARQTAEGFPRAAVRGTYNGTVSGGSWLGPNELLPNTPFVLLPVKTKLNEISWSNQTANVQFRIQFRTVSKTDTIFHTLTVTSPNSGYGYVSGLNYTFNPGTVIYAQYQDDGTNCSDMDLMLWISRIP